MFDINYMQNQKIVRNYLNFFKRNVLISNETFDKTVYSQIFFMRVVHLHCTLNEF